MGDSGLKWKLLLLALLLISLSSQTVTPCPHCYRTDIFLDYTQDFDTNETWVLATLVGTSQEYHSELSYDELYDRYVKAVSGDFGSIDPYDPSSTGKGDVKPVEDADIYFHYYGYTSDPHTGYLTREAVPIPGCDPVPTDVHGLAVCELPHYVYENKCVQIYAEYQGSPFLYPTNSFAYICDQRVLLFEHLGTAVLGTHLDPSNPLCFFALLLFGLFLASMFFTGRSPMSLLDITTPLLPKPKLIVFSGLLYTKWGVKMGAELGRNIDQSDKTLLQLSNRLINRLGRADRKAAYKLLQKHKKNPLLLYLALRELAASANMKNVRAILDRDLKDEGDIGELGQFISRLKNQRGLTQEDLIGLDTAWMGINARIQQMLLGEAAGGVKGSMGVVKKWVNKVPWVGRQFSAGIGSAYMGMRHTWRLTKSSLYGAMVAYDTLRGGKFLRDLRGKALARPGASRALYEFYTSKEERFRLFRVDLREARTYNVMMEQAYKEVAAYVMLQIMRKYGVKPELSEEELLNIGRFREGTPNGNILQHMKLSGLPVNVEREMLAILSDTNTKMNQKILFLMRLADAHGVWYDGGRLLGVLARLHSIDATALPESAKLQQLWEYLINDWNVTDDVDFRAQAGGSHRFYFLLGRNEMKYAMGNDTKYDDTWRFYYSMMLIEQARDKDFKADHYLRGPGRFSEDVAMMSFSKMVNELYGIVPSTTKGLNAEVALIMRQTEKFLKHLLTGEGETAADKYGLLSTLYSPETKLKGGELGVSAETAREYGARPEFWKLNMKGYWRILDYEGLKLGETLTGTLARTSVMQEAYQMSTGGHVEKLPFATSADFELAKDKKGKFDPVWSAYAHKFFSDRLKNMVGSKYPNAYFFAQDEIDFLFRVRDAYRERYCELKGIDRKNLERAQGRTSANSWIDERMGRDKFLESTISFRDLSNHTWMKVREGTYLPYAEGIRVSDADRIINGRLSIQKNGQWIEFDPHPILWSKELTKDFYKESRDLMTEIGQDQNDVPGISRRKTIDNHLKAKLDNFQGRLTQWGKDNNKQEIAAATLYAMSSQLGDFWLLDNSHLVKIQPRAMLEDRKGLMDKVSLAFMRGWESTMVSAFMPQMKTMYDLTAHSEYYRDKMNKLSANIMNQDFDRLHPDLAKQYKELVTSAMRYHNVWDDAITRSPLGNTSAIGNMFIFASYFHHGPAVHFDPTWNLDHFKGTRWEFFQRIRQMPITINWLVGSPFILASRGMMSSKLGHPTRQDKSFDPMRGWHTTMPRTFEGWRAFLNPFYSGIDFNAGSWKRLTTLALPAAFPIALPIYAASPLIKKISQEPKGMLGTIAKAGDKLAGWSNSMGSYDPKAYAPTSMIEQGIRERLEGPLIRKDYGGRELSMGLRRTNEDASYIMKNMNVIWGNANPGCSYLDWENNMRMDPKLATHLTHGAKYSSFYGKDDYIHKQANLGIIKRTTSALRLQSMREEELREYGDTVWGGFKRNPLWAWVNPAAFAVHMPLTPMFSARHAQEKVRSWRQAYHGWKREQEALPAYQQTSAVNYVMGMAMSKAWNIPYKVGGAAARLVGRGDYPSFFNTNLKYCSSCGGSMMPGRPCPRCARSSAPCPNCGSHVNPSLYHDCKARRGRPIRLRYNPNTGRYDPVRPTDFLLKW